MSEENKTQDPQNDDIMKEAEEILSSEPQDEVSQTTPEPSAAESTAETSPEQPAEEKAPESQAEAEIKSLKSQLNESKDRYVRLMAEFDNYRRRTAKEQLDIIETANAKLLEKLSEVLDNFERASHPDNNKQKDYDSFAKGIQMIHDQFAKILSDAGLEQLDPVGEPFDPNIHEALMNQPSDTVPESHVVQVFQKGYRLKNKLLKTAKVIVSSGPVSK